MSTHHPTSTDGGRPVWLFMAATAMATTISTLAATAMVESDQGPTEVVCSCEPAAAVAPELACAPPVVPTEAEPVQAPAPVEQPDTTVEQTDATVAPEKQIRATVEGPLDKAVIRRIVRAHINEVRYCYNEGLGRDPDLGGRVVVAFTIGADGKVASTEISDDSLGDEEVSSCIAEAIERWRFPKPAGGEKVQVSYPFVLEPG